MSHSKHYCLVSQDNARVNFQKIKTSSLVFPSQALVWLVKIIIIIKEFHDFLNFWDISSSSKYVLMTMTVLLIKTKIYQGFYFSMSTIWCVINSHMVALWDLDPHQNLNVQPTFKQFWTGNGYRYETRMNLVKSIHLTFHTSVSFVQIQRITFAPGYTYAWLIDPASGICFQYP